MNIKKIFFSFLFLLTYEVSFGQNKIELDEAIRISIENNLELKSLQFNIEKEESGIQSAVNIPKLGLFLEYEGVKGGLKNFGERKIGLKQDFEFPTVYTNRAAVQDYQTEIARAQLQKNINNIRSDVKENYAALVFSKNSIRIAKENLKFYEDFVNTAEIKYREGAGSNLELLGAKVNRIKFDNLIKNLESDAASSMLELNRLLNVSYSVEVSGEQTFKKYNFTKDKLVRTALASNPELKIIKLTKLQSDSKVSLAISELLPDFSISYYNQKIGSESGYYGVEFGIGLPVWFWWEPAGKINRAKSELKISNSDELNLSRIIETKVLTAYEAYTNSLRQINFFTNEALMEADELVRVSKISYEEGAIGYSEYLQTLNTGNEVRTQYLEALYNYNLSIINLERLTGKEL